MGVSNERAFAILLALQGGRTIAEVAADVPSRRAAGGSPNSVSPATARQHAQAGMRVLLTGVLRDRPPEGLPPALWPPAEVREAIRLIPAGRTGLGRRAALRAWIKIGELD